MDAITPSFFSHTKKSNRESVISLFDVTIARGRKIILDKISFSIFSGEFIGVLGPNGAGKTTLIHTLMGLLPFSGQIQILGKPIQRGNPSIGYIPQIRTSLADHRIAGRDLISSAIDGHRWGIPLRRNVRERAVQTALDRVGAGHLADRAVNELSGGERQHLLLAQCLVSNSKVLLLDEPLIGLDAYHQQKIVALIRDVTRGFNSTTLFSAHELNPLLGMIDRVLYLGNGSAALGTIDEVITTPILSRIYNAPIEVMRFNGRIFVMSNGQLIDRDLHDFAFSNSNR